MFFRDINFHAIIVEKQLIKHDILTHCLTCNFHHMSPVGVERSNGTPTGTSRLPQRMARGLKFKIYEVRWSVQSSR